MSGAVVKIYLSKKIFDSLKEDTELINKSADDHYIQKIKEKVKEEEKKTNEEIMVKTENGGGKNL